MKVSFVLVLILAFAVSNGESWRFRGSSAGNDANDEPAKKRRLQGGPCGTIGEAALAEFQLTLEDCQLAVDNAQREEGCEIFEGACPGGCPSPEESCIIVPTGGHTGMTECSTKEKCAIDHNVTELACQLVCDEDILLGVGNP